MRCRAHSCMLLVSLKGSACADMLLEESPGNPECRSVFVLLVPRVSRALLSSSHQGGECEATG
jgi:hypothetical protein